MALTECKNTQKISAVSQEMFIQVEPYRFYRCGLLVSNFTSDVKVSQLLDLQLQSSPTLHVIKFFFDIVSDGRSELEALTSQELFLISRLSFSCEMPFQCLQNGLCFRGTCFYISKLCIKSSNQQSA